MQLTNSCHITTTKERGTSLLTCAGDPGKQEKARNPTPLSVRSVDRSLSYFDYPFSQAEPRNRLLMQYSDLRSDLP